MDSTENIKRRKFLGIWLVFIGALLLTTLTIWAKLREDDSLLVAFRLDSAIAKYREAGLPWVASEIEPRIPDADNAAIEMLEAKALLPSSLVSIQQKLVKATLEGDRSQIAKTLQSIEPALLKYSEAAQKPSMRFPIEWDRGLFAERYESSFASIVEVFLLRAEDRATQGDLSGALADLEVAGKIAALISQGSTLYGISSGSKCQLLAFKCSLKLAKYYENDETKLSQILSVVERIDESFRFADSLRRSCYLGLATLRNVRNGDLTAIHSLQSEPHLEPHPTILTTGSPEGTQSQAFFVRYLEAQVQLKEIESKFDSEDLDMYEEMAKYVSTYENRPTRASALGVRSIRHNYLAIGHTIVKTRFYKVATIEMLRLLEYKATYGQYYRDVQKLRTQLTDPLTGEGVKIAFDDDSAQFYVFGQNGIDDNGVDSGFGDDWGVRFPPEPE